jgi:hypothetical protein
MGGGSGGTPQTLPVGGLSGQGGGRILPGAVSGVGELITALPRSLPTHTLNPAYPDRRPNAPLGWLDLDTAFCQPGGGPGEPGKGSEYVIYSTIITLQDGTTTIGLARGMGGGGGGWGAAGGTGDHLTFDQSLGFETRIFGGNPGGAGGKAINTNGHAVTWLGGANRAYGAVG